MGTLMDKLNATNASKEQIRQAIERKKVSVPTNTPLKDYPAKIDGIYPDALFLKSVTMPSAVISNNNISSSSRVMSVSNGRIMVALSDYSSYYLYANNGNNFMVRSLPSNSDYDYSGRSICYAKGLFLIGTKKRILYSTDGVSWKESVLRNDDTFYCKYIIYGNGAFYASFSEEYNRGAFECFKSTDGKTWNKIACTNPIRFANNGKFISGRENGGGVSYSTDLKNWKNIDAISSNNILKSVCYNEKTGEYFFSLGVINYSNGYLYSTKDFVNLKYYTMPKDVATNGGFQDLTYYNGIILCGYNCVVYGNSDVVYIGNPINETGSPRRYYQPHSNAVLVNGLFSRIFIDDYVSSPLTFRILYSANGLSWGHNLGSCVDVNSNNKTLEMLGFLNATPTALLQAAYEAGVNSI